MEELEGHVAAMAWDWDTEDIVLKPLLRWRLIKILDDREADDVHDQGKIKKIVVYNCPIHDDMVNSLAPNVAVSTYD